jgi:hypothetical protein
MKPGAVPDANRGGSAGSISDSATANNRGEVPVKERGLGFAARWTPLVLVVALIAWRIWLLEFRLYDPDEFEHLHAGLELARGSIPYRDFFEHHGPLTYALAAPLAGLIGPEPALLSANRGLSLSLVLVTLALIRPLSAAIMARRSGSPSATEVSRVTLLAIATLLMFPWFSEKGVEWRPDVLAMALMTAAAWRLTTPVRPSNASATTESVGDRTWSTGLLAGLAALATLKVVWLALGLALGWSIDRLLRRRPFLRPAMLGVTATLIPWIVTAALLAPLGATDDFLRGVILIPATWETTSAETAFVLSPLHVSPLPYCLMLLAMIGGAARFLVRHPNAAAGRILLAGGSAHALMAWFQPALYLQYHLLALPIWMALGAGELHRWLTPPNGSSRPGRAGFAVLGAGLSTASLVITARALSAMTGADLVQVATGEGGSALAMHRCLAWGELLGTGAVMLGLLISSLATGPRLTPIAVVTLLFGLALPGAVRTMIPGVFWSRARQMADLAAVREQLDPRDPTATILDGYTGLGCLHRHADYWWWLNHHSIPLANRIEGRAGLLARLRAARPRAVLVDENLLLLGEPELMSLLTDYRRSDLRFQSVRATLFLRNDP